jgi:predicted O-methyltransferase YrrM
MRGSISGGAPEPSWVAVDDYFAAELLPDQAPFDALLAANAAAGLPAIDVSAAQGALLGLFARLTGAGAVLEVGTLGGYSTLWLARALAPGGRIVTLEVDPHHAEVARANLDRAGAGGSVKIVVGPALETLPGLSGPFDLVFVDADKQRSADYVELAVPLCRPGALIAVDNVVRRGALADAGSDDPKVVGSRRVVELVGAHPRLTATGLQTVGAKGWDGLVLAVVT